MDRDREDDEEEDRPKLQQEQQQQQYEDDGYRDLVEWVESHGGRVDRRMSIGNDVDGIRGMMALEDMDANVELLHCPWTLVIGSSGSTIEDHQTMDTQEDMCRVIQILAAEYRLGDKSLGWPYLKHIGELPRLAAMWDAAAVAELQNLPPSQDLDRHLQWYSQTCRSGNSRPQEGGDAGYVDLKNDDAATLQALVAFITRANQVGMTPIYDLLNHHNGWKNAKLFLTQDGVDLRTVQPVQKGQQLYLSYGLKAASQMFRDYGFVEDWPSLWSWQDASTLDNHVFALFPDGIAAIHPSPDFLKDIWKQSSSTSTSASSSSVRITTLAEFQQRATDFSHSVPIEDLMRFSSAATNLLQGLPTTLLEDAAILRDKIEERRLLLLAHRGGSQSTTYSSIVVGLEDIIAAIQYRMTFKRAVSEALLVSEGILLRNGTGMEHEL